MKITFIGAAHQVTGSCTLVEWMDNRYFLVDYGMEQGKMILSCRSCPLRRDRLNMYF